MTDEIKMWIDKVREHMPLRELVRLKSTTYQELYRLQDELWFNGCNIVFYGVDVLIDRYLNKHNIFSAKLIELDVGWEKRHKLLAEKNEHLLTK